MRTITALKAAGDSDLGLQREVNEDRFHCDIARGLFIVIDGVGGQAAGGKAADTALAMLRTRLERETGPTTERIREAITIANNEIFRLASARPEWNGMACVLTVVVVDDGRAIVGHIGDTRLYKLRNDQIEKITRDHSPIGEREDANEISELEAMRHPRRNEVYRDVGSEPHQPADVDFIDIHEVPFEADAALLLCSDGLTDLVHSNSITHVVRRFAGQPYHVTRALIQAANEAGGKDNVTVVYVEGEQFAARPAGLDPVIKNLTEHGTPDVRIGDRDARGGPAYQQTSRLRWWTRLSLIVILVLVSALAVFRMSDRWRTWIPSLVTRAMPGSVLVVAPTESIEAALERAQPGSAVIVEPGEYRARLVLRDNVRVLSRVARGATIRLPGVAAEGEAAVVATGVKGAQLSGFRIVGDAATPLGTGVFIRDADVTLADVEVTGAVNVAVDIGGASEAALIASDIHDNSGAALTIRAGASPRIVHNAFVRNGISERTARALIIETGARPWLAGNVFQGITPAAIVGPDDAARAELMRNNWFPGLHEPERLVPSTAPKRQRQAVRSGPLGSTQ